MRVWGLARGYIFVMVALYSACRFERAARATDNTRYLLGRNPTALVQFVEDYRDIFTDM